MRSKISLLGMLMMSALFIQASKTIPDEDLSIPFIKDMTGAIHDNLTDAKIENSSSNSLAALVPGLLIDVSVSNTNPGPLDQVCYKMRYRCASTIEHCTNSNITIELPNVLNIGQYTGAGGNVANVTISGSSFTYDLVSPSSAGAPVGALAAGSSGILEICGTFPCKSGTQTPSAGSTINLASAAVFSASGTSSTASNPADVTVPTFDDCPPTSTSTSSFGKLSYNQGYKANPDGKIHWNIQIPGNQEMVIIDTIPNGTFLATSYEGLSNGLTYEVLCGGTWYDISVFNSTMGWVNDALINNTTNNLYDDLNATGNQTGCQAIQYTTAGVNGAGYYVTADAIRLTTPVGGLPSYHEFNFYAYVDPSVVPGTVITNCAESDTDGLDCVSTDIVAEPILVATKESETGIGDVTIPSMVSGVDPTLTKEFDEILWSIKFSPAIGNGYDLGGFVIIDTLPLGLEYDTNDWWTIFMYNNQEQSPSTNQYNNLDCRNPIFSTYMVGNQTVVKWEFPPSCIAYSNVSAYSTDIWIFFKTTYDSSIPLPDIFWNGQVDFSLSSEEKVQCTHPFEEQQLCACPVQDDSSNWPQRDSTDSPVPITGGDINSSKWVKGLYDTGFSRFPYFGDTDTSGVGTYEIFIKNTSLSNIKQIDIIDVLPHIGDTSLTAPAIDRGSQWSAELSGSIIVERLNIGASNYVDASSEISGPILYSNTYSPCFMDGSLQIKAQTGLTLSTKASCGSGDFSSSNPSTGARGFAFVWENVASPLLFGEVLKITVPIRQLSGEVNATSGDIAWNSFAFTAIEEDDDELFSSEPLKVGIQMINPDLTAGLGDYVWVDANADGIQDPGEAPIQGATVSIYDAFGNPVMINGTPQTALTDANGFYSFNGLDPTTQYIVRLDNPVDYTGSGPLAPYLLTTADAGTNDATDSDAVIGDSGGIFATPFPEINNASTMASSTHTPTYDFGFYKPATICGYAWDDADEEGDQDFTEAPMDSVQIELVDANGIIVAIDTTDVAGNYSFSDLLPGQYTLQVTILGAGGYVFTAANQGTTDSDDSDVNSNGEIGPLILAGCEISCNNDIGLKLPPAGPATIRGTVWDELAKDGIHGVDEIVVSGVTVNLLDGLGFVLNTMLTDVNGNYEFDNLAPNVNYTINVVPNVGIPITPIQDAGTDDTIDSDVNPTTGNSGTITPTANEIIEDVDAGICGPYSIGNLVFQDINDNGIHDSGEGVFPGITVYLYDNTTSTLLSIAITDPNGKYVFKGLDEGDYRIEVVVPPGYRSSTDVGGTATPNSVDNDDNGNGIGDVSNIQSSVLTITTGGGTNGDPNWTEADHGQPISGAIDNTSNPKAYYTVDFGYYLKPTCFAVESEFEDRYICDGDLVDSLAFATGYENPDSIAFVYFTSAQTDTAQIYSAGIGIDTVQIQSNTGMVSITDLSIFTNSGTSNDTFYVYGIVLPIPEEEDCRPFDEIMVVVYPSEEPYEVCDDGISTATLTADANLTNVVWYNSADVQVGTGNTMTVDGNTPGMEDDVDYFYYTADGAGGCPNGSCCPIEIQLIDCCKDEICLPVNITIDRGIRN